MADIPPRQQVNGSETIRMGQTEGLPKIEDDPGAAGPYADAPRYGAVARRTPSGDDQALAILKAFQDYMEHERQRAQRRTSTVILAFAALLAIVVAAFAAIWFSTMSGIRGTQTDLIRAALAAREAPPQPQIDVAAAIATAVEKAAEGNSAAMAEAVALAEKRAAERAEAAAQAERKAAERAEAELAARRAEEAKALEDRLAEERKANAEAAAAQKEAFAQSLANLNATIEAVRKDNERLRKDNEALRAKAKPAAAQPEPKPAPAAAAQPAPRAEADQPPVARIETIAPTVTVKRPAPPKGYAEKTVRIPVGEKGDSQVNWRLFIPTEAKLP